MREASLLDDARFLEELAKIEELPTEDTSVLPRPVPTVGSNQPPTAVADGLPPALGPRTKGPQFVLAPPPSKRRSYRSSSRSAARSRTAVIDNASAVATATENLAATAEDFSRAASDEQGATPAPEPVLATENTEVDASLSAFPSESARATANTNTTRKRASDAKRGAPLHPALAVVGFVLMMSVGAAVAALVFHDRVTQIVQLLGQSAERR
jgi:hypothetical protein